ncbi:MAG: hypothetical protein QIT35_gp30 [Methanophagales virus PBV299]|uniref:DUF2341 domain-containing protein n=1 Tax=Methanophagales virus PBV299 TaxID=2987730 RepID=A0ABY6GLS9_9CAUD|nr:MAG: hypothetical protein QIT35_gp30 [Methanophagales virus PBV299]UYL64826.1 MAG: hypothetical protein OFDIEDLO_00030 [Methanophagales virus PBV299]
MMIELPQRCFIGRVNPKWFARVRPLYLNYTGSEVLTDYQVKCVFTHADIPFGKLRADKQDLLFVDSNNEAIPYWLEEANASKIVVWLKFHKIETGKEVFWLYFGNSRFSGPSSGDEIFIFFDDFEGTSLDANKWNTYNDGGSYSVSNSMVRVTGYQIISKTYQITDGIIEVKEKITALEGSIFARAEGNSGNQWVHSYGLGSGDFGAGKEWNLAIAEDNKPKFWDTTQAIQNEWLLLRFTLNGDHLKGERFKYADMSPNGGPVEGTLTKYSSGYIGLRTTGNDRTCYYDWILVRKYAEPEPFIEV